MDKMLVDRFYRLAELMKKHAMSNPHVGAISKSEFFMLMFIESNSKGMDVVTTAVISERLHISKPAVSQTINMLEKKQYVKREIYKDDRRLMNILITDLGVEILKGENNRFLSKINDALDEMGKEDSETFINLMEKYFNILMNAHKNDS